MDWKTRQIAEILGLPNLDTMYLPVHAVIALKDRLAKIKDIGAVILFGSIVRGEGSPKSDIDIMVVPAKAEKTMNLEGTVANILKEIETEYKLPVSFSMLIYTGLEDPYFLWETVKDGVVLYIKPKLAIQTPQTVKPYALISYSYTGLTENEKKRLSRFLFEAKSGLKVDKSNKLEYIAPGVILLTPERSELVVEFFNELGLRYSLIKIWR